MTGPAPDGPDPGAVERLAGATVEHVPVARLTVADSPRRAGADPAHVRVLALVAGPLPPLVVDRATMRVIDGVHRLQAAVLRGADRVPVRFVDAADHDCFVLAVQLNARHGLPLTAADRVAAAARVAAAHPWWSDRAVANLVGVSPKTVAARRSGVAVPQLDTRVGRDGRVRPVDMTARRRRAASFLAEHPDASLRRIALAAGISPATAGDVRARVRSGADPVPPRRPRCAAAAVPAVPADVSAPDDFTRRLRGDPAFRSSAAGRFLLRLLAEHRIASEYADELGATVPEHCVDWVSEALHRSISTLQELAATIERRAATH